MLKVSRIPGCNSRSVCLRNGGDLCVKQSDGPPSRTATNRYGRESARRSLVKWEDSLGEELWKHTFSREQQTASSFSRGKEFDTVKNFSQSDRGSEQQSGRLIREPPRHSRIRRGRHCLGDHVGIENDHSRTVILSSVLESARAAVFGGLLRRKAQIFHGWLFLSPEAGQ